MRRMAGPLTDSRVSTSDIGNAGENLAAMEVSRHRRFARLRSCSAASRCCEAGRRGLIPAAASKDGPGHGLSPWTGADGCVGRCVRSSTERRSRTCRTTCAALSPASVFLSLAPSTRPRHLKPGVTNPADRWRLTSLNGMAGPLMVRPRVEGRQHRQIQWAVPSNRRGNRHDDRYDHSDPMPEVRP